VLSTLSDVDIVAADFHGMGRHGLEGWKAERLAGSDVESCPVTRATNLAACELTVGQGATIVSADVVDGVDSSLDVEESDRAAIKISKKLAAGRKISKMCQLDHIRHSNDLFEDHGPETDFLQDFEVSALTSHQRLRDLRLQANENTGQTANAQHAEDFGKPEAFDEIITDLKNLSERDAIQALNENRNEAPDGRGFDRCICENGDVVTFEFDEQVDGRLAFLNAMRSVFVSFKSFREGRKAFGKVNEKFDPLLAVGIRKLFYDRIKSGNHGTSSIELVSKKNAQLPFAIGARTRLPHSHHEPS
jgi:hypothetical protein